VRKLAVFFKRGEEIYYSYLNTPLSIPFYCRRDTNGAKRAKCSSLSYKNIPIKAGLQIKATECF